MEATEKKGLIWLDAFARKWISSVEKGRQPHAVMLAGPPGVGKRAAAAWMVARKLGLAEEPLPVYPDAIPRHADLRWISPAEGKSSILIDQVRILVDELGLTSYEGSGKAAVIEPADLMTINAANSLLKTLEEPPGDTLLILVADRVGRLPATVFSRCQRLEFRVPEEAVALRWLDGVSPGTSWAEPLRLAGFAPLRAIQAAEEMDTTASLGKEFLAVARGERSPVDVAASWGKLDAPMVLEWLARTVQGLARSGVTGTGGTPLPDSVRQRMDLRNLFCYLDSINRLRSQPAGSYNPQTALEGLLIDWATGLAEVGDPSSPAVMTRHRR